jgi:hypothetical protein
MDGRCAGCPDSATRNWFIQSLRADLVVLARAHLPTRLGWFSILDQLRLNVGQPHLGGCLAAVLCGLFSLCFHLCQNVREGIANGLPAQIRRNVCPERTHNFTLWTTHTKSHLRRCFRFGRTGASPAGGVNARYTTRTGDAVRTPTPVERGEQEPEVRNTFEALFFRRCQPPTHTLVLRQLSSSPEVLERGCKNASRRHRRNFY